MKKFFYLFAISALVLGMASCGDGNDPEPEPESEQKSIQLEVSALSSKVRIVTITSDPNTYFYASFMEKALLENMYGSIENSINTAFKDIAVEDIKKYLLFKDYHVTQQTVAANTDYYAYACYVKVSANKVEIDGEIYSQEFTTMPEHILNGEFTVNDAGKKVHFYSSNMGKYPWIENNSFYNDQWWCLGTSQTNMVHDQFPWSEANDPNVPVLAADEWLYLFHKRPNAEKLFAHATLTIDDDVTKGIILLPDNWEKPDNSPLRTDFDLEILWNEENKNYKKDGLDGYAANNLNKDQWTDLEFAGAVFLPAAGANGSSKNMYGHYWTSSPRSETNAHKFSFGRDNISLTTLYTTGSAQKTNNYAIRPVRELK